ncbi:MAG: MBL fold metallo-hydrolase, partial [Chloroflexi bacterium]|nr:MBL fold metallo-hydrolase [Chloroflexota bacterium]
MGNPASAPSGSVLFIGTATTLIRFGGFTILTDPNFLHRGDEVHLGYGLRSTRQTEPALGLDQLPQLDLIILSHFHEDHFDRLVQQRLARDIPIVTTPDAARALRALGFSQVRELTTWDTWNFRRDDLRLRITAVPAQHTPLRLMQPLLPRTMGSVLSFSQVQTEEQLLR